MANKKTRQLMTIDDFEKLGIINYAVGVYKERYFITPVKFKGDSKLKAFPLFEDKESYEITEKLYRHLCKTDW